MSKVRDLPEITSLDDQDLIYAVDSSEGNNGGRKITKSNLKTSVNQSALEIKTSYESNADTNAFTDSEKSKLTGIESGATTDQNANEVPYDNSISGLTATNVKTAIDEVNVEAQGDFKPSTVSGRILAYTGGTARFDNNVYELTSNNILLNQNITGGEVYVDIDGIVKQTGSGIASPPFTVVFARFSTDLNDILSFIDIRIKSSQNIVMGLVSDVLDVRAGAAAFEGSTGRISDAGHKHNVLTAVVSTQIPNQSNAEGSAIGLARADHIHNIPTAVPISQTPDQTNAEGNASSFARSNHVHNIPTAAPSTIGTTNSQGSGVAFSKNDHIHAHGDQTSGSLHAAATSSINGFMSAADKTKLDTLVFGFLSYSNVGNQSTTQNNTAFTSVVFDSDTGSLANGLLTKVNTTQFRADFTGYIRVSVKIQAQNVSSNDVAWRAAILKNAALIPHTVIQGNGRTNTGRYNTPTGTFMIPCTDGDIFTIGFSNAEAATDTITIFANGASVNVHAMYKTA